MICYDVRLSNGENSLRFILDYDLIKYGYIRSLTKPGFLNYIRYSLGRGSGPAGVRCIDAPPDWPRWP